MKKIILVAMVMGLIFFNLAFVSAATRDIWEIYHTSDEVNSLLKGLAAKHSSLMSYEVIGKSIQGKDIYMFKIGNPNGGKFMFDGRIHGPEDCGTELGIQFIKWVLESSDADAKRVRERNYLLFIPLINGDSIKRGNLRRSYTYPDGTKISIPYGVDLNRNFPTDWGTSGSGDPSDDYDYRGPYAGSEPETQAVLNAMKKYKPNIYMNVHCGMEMLGYDQSTTTSAKVLSLITNISARTGAGTNYYYSPRRGGCGGGMACNDGAVYSGGNGWLFESTEWEHMPDTLAEFLRVWYPRAFPVYLAMAQAVEKIPTSSYCGDGTCNSNENCSTCSKDCGTCPVTSTKITGCNIPDLTWNEDGVVVNAYDLSSCFNDPLGHVLSYGYAEKKYVNVNITKDGKVTLSAPKDWYGTDYISFKAVDGDRVGWTNKALLTVRSVPDCGDGVCEGSESCSSCSKDCGACTVTSTKITGCKIPDLTWNEDGVVVNAYDLSSCFNDPLGHVLSYGYAEKKYVNVNITKDGKVTLSAPKDWYGTDYISFKAVDGDRVGWTNKALLTVRSVPDCGDGVCEGSESCSSCSKDCGTCTVSNTKITGCNIPDLTWNEDESFVGAYDLNSCFNDPLGRDLSFVSAEKKVITVSIKNGIVTLTPPADWSGTDYVSFRASDGTRTAWTNKALLTVLPMPECGDGVCDEKESCESCASDCGECPKKSSGGGGGGGGSLLTYYDLAVDSSDAEPEASEPAIDEPEEAEPQKIIVSLDDVGLGSGDGGSGGNVFIGVDEEAASSTGAVAAIPDTRLRVASSSAIMDRQMTGAMSGSSGGLTHSPALLMLVIAFLSLGVFGAYSNFKGKMRFGVVKQSIVYNHISEIDWGHMSALYNYVDEALKRNYSKEKMKSDLLSVGWSFGVVDSLLNTYLPPELPDSPGVQTALDTYAEPKIK